MNKNESVCPGQIFFSHGLSRPTSTLAYTINLFPSYLKKLTGYTHMVERMGNFRKEQILWYTNLSDV